MQNQKDGNVRAWDGLPGPQGEWKLSKIKHPTLDNIFLFTTKKWSDWYMYMQDNQEKNVRAWDMKKDNEMEGNKSYWILTPCDDP